MKGTTLLVAAHRTATLLGCDEIIVLEKGVLVERGAPDALFEDEGSLFNAMHARQRLQTEIDEAQ
jgi:ATP-binding cassette subfamily B protein